MVLNADLTAVDVWGRGVATGYGVSQRVSWLYIGCYWSFEQEWTRKETYFSTQQTAEGVHLSDRRRALMPLFCCSNSLTRFSSTKIARPPAAIFTRLEPKIAMASYGHMWSYDKLCPMRKLSDTSWIPLDVSLLRSRLLMTLVQS